MKKMVDGVLMDCTPEEEAAIEAIRAIPLVGTDKLDMGPSIAHDLGEPVNVKS